LHQVLNVSCGRLGRWVLRGKGGLAPATFAYRQPVWPSAQQRFKPVVDGIGAQAAANRCERPLPAHASDDLQQGSGTFAQGGERRVITKVHQQGALLLRERYGAMGRISPSSSKRSRARACREVVYRFFLKDH
jgi:hypothetical protein